MLVRFYVLPIWIVILGTISVVILYSIIKFLLEFYNCSSKISNFCYYITIFLSFLLIITSTLIGRPSDIFILKLAPFQSFVDAKTQPETYRTMLMNVVLFVPFGMGLSCGVSKYCSKTKSMLITVSIAFVLCTVIEITQFVFGMGLCQTDDVICNVLGSVLGSLSLPLSTYWDKIFLKNNTSKKLL